MAYLLRWDIICLCPHVNLLIMINAGNDEEHARSPSSALQETSKSEDDGPLIFLTGKVFLVSNALHELK